MNISLTACIQEGVTIPMAGVAGMGLILTVRAVPCSVIYIYDPNIGVVMTVEPVDGRTVTIATVPPHLTIVRGVSGSVIVPLFVCPVRTVAPTVIDKMERNRVTISANEIVTAFPVPTEERAQ